MRRTCGILDKALTCELHRQRQAYHSYPYRSSLIGTYLFRFWCFRTVKRTMSIASTCHIWWRDPTTTAMAATERSSVAMSLNIPVPQRHVFALNVLAWIALLGACLADYQTYRSPSRSSMSCHSTFRRQHGRHRPLTGMPLRSSELASAR